MKIYLDIDGVLINSDGTPTPHVYEFLSHCVDSHECFWLTTHCRFNDPENAVSYLSDKLSDKCLPLLKQIKGTQWDILKTDAIDFSSVFLWLDDYLMQSEEEVLEEHNAREKHILIELKKNPEQLKEVLEKVLNSNNNHL